MARISPIHLFAAGLFLIAGVFYLAEMGTGATAFLVLGAILEAAAWISMLGDPPESSSQKDDR